MQKRPFTELGLSPEILKAVDKMGFEEASPIQTAVIPVILSGRDAIGQSSTGSGKTAAFGIPAIEKIDVHKKAVQVLVLCPTRELAVQVSEEIAKLAQFKRGLHAVPVYGGQSYERQFRALASGVQIVIGTPGRVIDHIERGTLSLDALKFLVLDEADRMLDMGFREDIERVLSAAPKDRQLLFFSATMPKAIQDIIRRFSKNPEWIKIEAVAQNAPQVDQVYYEIDRRSKVEILTRLIDLNDFNYGIIFCATKNMVDELDNTLHARGYMVDRLHGDITQAQRNRVMEKFKRRGFEFLVATDVAARGLDVDDLEVVFNYDLPNDAEDYTHRIGRTGRAGRSGRAITFVSGRELWELQSMIRYGKLKIRRENVPSLDMVEEARENAFFEKLRTLLNDAKFKRNDRLIDRLLEQGYASTDIINALLHIIHGADKKPAKQAAAKSGAGSPPAFDNDKPPSFGKQKSKKFDNPPRKFGDKKPSKFFEEFVDSKPRHKKQKYERAARTGNEPGMTTLFFNVGRKHLVTPADIVGKIAGVTRQPAGIVGAMDICQRHTLVDVASDSVEIVLKKLSGIRIKNVALQPALATPDKLSSAD